MKRSLSNLFKSNQPNQPKHIKLSELNKNELLENSLKKWKINIGKGTGNDRRELRNHYQNLQKLIPKGDYQFGLLALQALLELEKQRLLRKVKSFNFRYKWFGDPNMPGWGMQNKELTSQMKLIDSLSREINDVLEKINLKKKDKQIITTSDFNDFRNQCYLICSGYIGFHYNEPKEPDHKIPRYVKENGEYVEKEELYSQYVQRSFLDYEENTALPFHDLTRKNFAEILIVIDVLKDVCKKELVEIPSSSSEMKSSYG